MKIKTTGTALSACVLSLMLSSPLLAGQHERGAAGTDAMSGAAAVGAERPDMSTSYTAKKLSELDVENRAGDKLGEISEVIIDQEGNASHLVLDVDGDRYAVPWDRAEVSQERIVLDVERDQLESEFAAFEEDGAAAVPPPADPGRSESAPLQPQSPIDPAGTPPTE